MLTMGVMPTPPAMRTMLSASVPGESEAPDRAARFDGDRRV
jgi:hypothetical protein